jgi:hypothetical protein
VWTILRAATKDFKLLDDGILLQGGKNIGYIKFSLRGAAQKLFNYMFYISIGDELLLFSIEYPRKLRKSWEPTAERMATSLRVLGGP